MLCNDLYKRKEKVIKECLKIVLLFVLLLYIHISHLYCCKFVTLICSISANQRFVVVLVLNFFIFCIIKDLIEN